MTCSVGKSNAHSDSSRYRVSQDYKMPPKAAKRKFQYAKGSVDGLAKNWADRAIVREKLLKSKTLLSWPERRLVGVISCRALKLNKQVMLAMADILGPQSDIPLGVVVQPMKAQALNPKP